MPAKPHLPEIETRSLEGERLIIPRELEGRLNLLAIAFQRTQQRAVDTWVPEFSRLEIARPGLVSYEIPVISRRWGPLRPLIDGGMTAAIPNPEARAHTLTAYTHVGRVIDALGVEDSGQIVVVLVDREGSIEWLHRGERSDPAVDSLESALGLSAS